MNIIKRFATQCPCWSTNEYQKSIGPNHPKSDKRYWQYYSTSKKKLMLHSVGCPRVSADVQANKWNQPTNTNGIAHAVIDSNDGDVRQTLPWEFRGWHCAGDANNFSIGVEMCESDQIRYTSGGKFVVLNREIALQHCETAYNSARDLFAQLCILFNADPMTDILSHKEGGQQGVASRHIDPEHYWGGLGTTHTMNGFRKDVKKKVEEYRTMLDEIKESIHKEVQAAIADALVQLSKATTDNITMAMNTIAETIDDRIESIVTEHTGRKAADVDNVPEWIRPQIQKLLDAGVINGGTPAEENPNDVNMYVEDLRVMAVMSAYIDKKFQQLEDKISAKQEE